MAGILDALDELTSGLSKHPGAEELLGAIPAIAGAWMLARPYRSTVGTPLGAALATLGGGIAAHGYSDEQRMRREQEQADKQKRLSTAFQQMEGAFPASGAAGPAMPLPEAMRKLTGAGATIPESLDIVKALQPPKAPEQTFQLFKEPGMQVSRFNTHQGTLEPIPNAPTIPAAKSAAEQGSYWYVPKGDGSTFVGPTFVARGTNPPPGSLREPPKPEKTSKAGKQSEFDFFRAAHPELSADDALRQFSALKRSPEKAEKPRYSFLFDTKGNLVRVNQDTLEKTVVGPGLSKSAPAKPKIIRAGDSLVGIGVGPDGTPTATKFFDIPKSVKDKNEFATFSEGYLSDHPDAKGPEIIRAYADARKGTPQPGHYKLGDAIIFYDRDTGDEIRRITAPASAKNKSEWADYAEGYLAKHPEADRTEIVKAYERDKAQARKVFDPNKIKTTINKGSAQYALDIDPATRALVYRIVPATKPGTFRSFLGGGAAETLPGPILPAGIVPYRKKDGTIGFATTKAAAPVMPHSKVVAGDE